MKILIEQSGHPLLNMGDLAMLQVAIARLRGFWPNASIQVFTVAPEKLAEYCPNTTPLLPDGRYVWLSPILPRAYKLPSNRAVQLWSDWESQLRRKSPRIVRSLLNFKLRRYPPELASNFEEFMEAIYGCDLVIASGGGYITDCFKGHAGSVLDTLDLANRIGKPTAMFGQGLGPLRDSKLLAKAKAVFPSLKLISLREKRNGITILNSMGVSKERIVTTGDDAIELAYNARCEELGSGIGINLRVANYSAINTDLFETIRVTLHKAAKQFGVPLIPVPISRSSYGEELSDSMAIQQLLKGYDVIYDGGQNLDNPIKVIHQIGHCRVVVTGSYHAGVFALAQGIPVVGLVKSEYYADKFLGLADQFSSGCEVVFLDEQNLSENLLSIIERFWEASEQLKPKLLEAAQQQIALAKAAYQRVYELV